MARSPFFGENAKQERFTDNSEGFSECSTKQIMENEGCFVMRKVFLFIKSNEVKLSSQK